MISFIKGKLLICSCVYKKKKKVKQLLPKPNNWFCQPWQQELECSIWNKVLFFPFIIRSDSAGPFLFAEL